MSTTYNKHCIVFLILLVLVTVARTKTAVDEYWTRDLNRTDVQFSLHTRKNPSGIFLNKDNINSIPKKRTVFLIGSRNHDTTLDSSYFHNFTELYIDNLNINVIKVHAIRALNSTILKYVDQIGKFVGDLLIELDSKRIVRYRKQHIIGVQVGSHIAGIAANYANSQKKFHKVNRITALSPSYTKYSHNRSIRQLKNTDADQVDVYVTSKSGLQEDIGTNTFYTNGGQRQPLCPLCTGNESDECSEFESVWYYIYSFGLKLPATVCDSYEDFLTKRCRHKGFVFYGESHRGYIKGKAYIWLYCWAPRECRHQS